MKISNFINILEKKEKKDLIYDPENTMFANLVSFVDDDKINNNLPNMHIRATHVSYIVGEFDEELDINGNLVYKDTINEENKKYPYFTSLTEAMVCMGSDKEDTLFVLKATPIYKIGIKEKCNKKELLSKLSNHKIIFNFDIEEEMQKLVKKR